MGGDPEYHIPGWVVIDGPPIAGDVIATKSFYADASGHVGIYRPMELGQHGTISASSYLGGRIVYNRWGFRSTDEQMPVIRRYVGEGK